MPVVDMREAAPLVIGALTDAIEEKEPRAEVVSIRLLRAEILDGQLRPVVTFKLREGVTL